MMPRPVPGDKDRIISSKRTNRCSRINDRDTLAVKIDPQVVNVSFTTDMLRVVLGRRQFHLPGTSILRSAPAFFPASTDLAATREGDSIAIGFGRTPVSRSDEIRLAARTDIRGKSGGDVKQLESGKSGEMIKVEKAGQGPPVSRLGGSSRHSSSHGVTSRKKLCSVSAK